jgi:hypothetical protein
MIPYLPVDEGGPEISCVSVEGLVGKIRLRANTVSGALFGDGPMALHHRQRDRGKRSVKDRSRPGVY